MFRLRKKGTLIRTDRSLRVLLCQNFLDTKTRGERETIESGGSESGGSESGSSESGDSLGDSLPPPFSKYSFVEFSHSFLVSK